jgi:FMN-dependent NADH-azoreductase
MKILHIDSSIQSDTSASRALSEAVVTRLRAVHADAEITYHDLATTPLPHLDFEGLTTVSANPALEEFLSADVVVIGAPMYNFGVASQLKAWLDHIIVAGRTFKYGPDGVIGLAAGKQVIVAHSRGGLYSDRPSATEHAESYLRAVFGFIGIADPEFVIAEGLAMGEEPRAAAMAAARAKIGELSLADLAKAA